MALVTIRRSSSVQTPRKSKETEKTEENVEDDAENIFSKSLNECYFANKGAAVVLDASERGCDRRLSPLLHAPLHPQPDIQHHLQSMFSLLRPEETLKMAVKLESAHAGRTRYLVVMCHGEEAALLGIDCNEGTTVGLVLRILADTSIKLDGDGGFSVCVCNRQHIFKPVSVQAMWSALQTLHRASGKARELNHFAGGPSHAWCLHYESRIDSDRSCLNEWHTMDSIESRRPPSPDSLRHKPREREETEKVIRCTLKEIMMSVDLDEVTSKVIRGRLEEELDMDLAEYKSFIDHEMLTILGQMDAPTEIFDHVYLGSEWNASNLEELQRNGIRNILNVTREIDNFFPGMFDYLNIRVYDDDKTDLLKHWDDTYKYINKARTEGSKVLVHCKMGISRSASVVIAYAMKAYNWNFKKALKHVKAKRNCIKPNTNFLNQLETYQGILDAMKNKEKLQRSKSETNLKMPKTTSKTENKVAEPTPLELALTGSYSSDRPKSWSPDSKLASELLPPTSVSLENLASETRHMLMPCANGCYSVSPNQIIRLKEDGTLSVKHIVNEIENAASSDRKETNKRCHRLNFGSQTESSSSRSSEMSIGPPLTATDVPAASGLPQLSPIQVVASKCSSNADVDRIHTWDPGEPWQGAIDEDKIVKSDSGIMDVKTHAKPSERLFSSIDRNLDVEERRCSEEEAPPPSRQSSWSSFDSAVVPDLSRHSSWGSYDTRQRAEELVRRRESADDDAPPPQRPLSDLGIISERAERCGVPLVTTTAATVADNERKFNETCAILKELAAPVSGTSAWAGRLSASAPADTWLRASLRRRRPACASHPDLPRAAPSVPSNAAAGLVSNLKKEFEARSELETVRRPAGLSRTRPSTHTAPAAPLEDLSVKVLVNRYDRPGGGSKKSRLAGEGGKEAGRRAAGVLRNSFCGAVRGSTGTDRPPLAPAAPGALGVPLDIRDGIVATVVAKAQTRKQLQHGKTHPLTRLNRSSNRCTNAVYNTM